MVTTTRNKFHLTQEGLKELEAELAELKTKRLEVAERLKDAKEQLDLTENSDWADAQDEFKFVEGRINEIEHILRNYKIIKSDGKAQQVQLGNKIELRHNGKKVSYILVGHLESNPKEHKLSYHSPVGRALMGKQVGDSVTIKTPSGTHRYSITHIT